MTTQQARLAAAYASLATQGRVTVRALKGEAGVSTDLAAQFLRAVAKQAEAPPAPDLSAAVGIVWAAAWKEAETQARDEFAQRLDEALEVQGAAEAQREAAEVAAATAISEAGDFAKKLEVEVERANAAEDALKSCREELRNLERLRTEDRERAVRAEAALDELRAVLETLRAPKPAPAKPASTATKATAAKASTAKKPASKPGAR